MVKVYEYFIVLILIFSLCFIVFPKYSQGQSFCGSSSQDACSAREDCVAGGCFKSVCRLKNQGSSSIPSIEDCDWDICYDHRAFGLVCDCFQSQCQWVLKNIDIVLTKTVNRTIAQVGEVITYTIIYKNQGKDDAHNVQIVDLIPAGTIYVSGTIQGGGICNVSVQNCTKITWNIGTVQPNATGSISFDVSVN